MIKFNQVTKKYGDSTVLDNVDFLIERGSFVYLIGPTGSGKTTIFRLIIRDLLPSVGEISIGEWDLVKLPKSKVTTLRRKIGVIFQDLKLLMDRTVVENVMLPLQMSGSDDKEARSRSEEILKEVGLESKVNQFPLQLSGGERQRVAIARALIFNPEIILADEPTGNLDTQTSFQILDLLKSINKKGTTIFMATHNDKIVEKSGDRVILISHGKILEDKHAPKKEKEAHKSEEHKKDEVHEKDEKHDVEEKDKKDQPSHKAPADEGKIKLESLAKEK